RRRRARPRVAEAGATRARAVRPAVALVADGPAPGRDRTASPTAGAWRAQARVGGARPRVLRRPRARAGDRRDRAHRADGSLALRCTDWVQQVRSAALDRLASCPVALLIEALALADQLAAERVR